MDAIKNFLTALQRSITPNRNVERNPSAVAARRTSQPLGGWCPEGTTYKVVNGKAICVSNKKHAYFHWPDGSIPLPNPSVGAPRPRFPGFEIPSAEDLFGGRRPDLRPFSPDEPLFPDGIPEGAAPDGAAPEGADPDGGGDADGGRWPGRPGGRWPGGRRPGWWGPRWQPVYYGVPAPTNALFCCLSADQQRILCDDPSSYPGNQFHGARIGYSDVLPYPIKPDTYGDPGVVVVRLVSGQEVRVRKACPTARQNPTFQGMGWGGYGWPLAPQQGGLMRLPDGSIRYVQGSQ